MKCVIICSPYRADTAAKRMVHLAYVEVALADSFARGEAPFAPHRLYPIVLNDGDASQRSQGMEAGKAWIANADLLAVYTDHGISAGMQSEIDLAERLGVETVFRSLPPAVL